MIGSAIGLGNIWRFPYILYSNGGGAFFIPYLIALAIFALPLLYLEYGVGFTFKGSAPLAFARGNPKTEIIGWITFISLFVITGYYSCLMAWILIYLVLSFTGGWGVDPVSFFTTHIQGVGTPGLGLVLPVLSTIIVIWLIIGLVTRRNINEGLAKASKFLLPTLVVIMVIIVGISLTLNGALVGLSELFIPRWELLMDPGIWVAAFAHVLFTVSLAMGVAIVFTSYLRGKNDFVKDGLTVIISNSAFEIFVSIAVFSILGFMAVKNGVGVNQVVDSGINLAFVVFPAIFNNLGVIGEILGPLFFICLFFAGLTTILSFVETFLASIVDKFGWSRGKTALLVSVSGLILGSLFATSYGVDILASVDYLANEFWMITIALLEVIVVGWVFNTDKILDNLNKHSKMKLGSLWKFLIRYVIPCILVFLLSSEFYRLIVNKVPFNTLLIYIVFTLSLIIVSVVLTRLKWKTPPKHGKY